ncbi:multiple inositol polyphosphate phosphatase 1-like [Choristoneura fumiferana]|uniref:multiple inositol polyphosphate phosphatase 1-like n=1 Tax=Choristoneura fumiferana TaxID=7141 RepID=UPI003D153B84
MRWALLLLALASAASSQDTCISSDDDPYVLFGTKTAYNFVNRQLSNRRPEDVPGCQPAAIWLLNRHGAHNPEADELSELERLNNYKDNVLNNYRTPGFRTNHNPQMCAADLALLSGWSFNILNRTFAGDLTSAGYMQTQDLGREWRRRYPSLFTTNNHDYLFKFANEKRFTDSFRAFTEGLFGAQAESIVMPRDNDEKLVRPYKFCPTWIKEVNDTSQNSQRNIFESKREFAEMVTNVSLRLGFNYDIDRDIIQRMYQMCRYNKAWDITKKSPWCGAFSREDLRRFEYAEDLETYTKYGYQSDLSPKLGCTQVKDFVNFFRNHVKEDAPVQPRVSVQFAETPLLLMLLTALGARHDNVPLTGDNYHTTAVQSRQWSNSIMDPFNANIAAVLYRCNPNGNFGFKDRYQILFLQNAQTMKIDNCRDGLCEWSHVISKFGDLADKCNLDFCNSAPRLNSFVSLSLTLVAFCFRYVM